MVMDLRLHLHKNEFPLPLVKYPLALPRLRRLVLRSDMDAAFARPAVLAEFARHAVCAVAYPISLTLENVFIDRGESILCEFFDSISYQSLALWRYPAPPPIPAFSTGFNEFPASAVQQQPGGALVPKSLPPFNELPPTAVQQQPGGALTPKALPTFHELPASAVQQQPGGALTPKALPTGFN
ncbi:hypothetical protein EXIGLDRAFT_838654, partial [Exidia glandulosa HHB12029]